MKNNNIITILALNSIKGIGAAAIKKLWLTGFFNNQDPFTGIGEGLEVLKKQQDSSTIEIVKQEAEKIINSCNSDEIKLIPISDDNYPQKITQIKNPPPVLFYKGNLDLTEKTIGVIGTRDPNKTARIIAGRIGKYFSDKGFSIVNGLALGIDREAIQLEDNYHSNTIGIMAGGLNYNQEKTLLRSTAIEAEKILDNGGLLLSEYQSGVKEDTFSVVKSCRLQAAVSDGLILVQSKLNGGSKFTIEAFCELERVLGIVKPIDVESGLPENEANIEIIKNREIGLVKMTGLKQEKIKLKNIEIIADKNGYSSFGELIVMNSTKSMNNTPGKLF